MVSPCTLFLVSADTARSDSRLVQLINLVTEKLPRSGSARTRSKASTSRMDFLRVPTLGSLYSEMPIRSAYRAIGNQPACRVAFVIARRMAADCSGVRSPEISTLVLPHVTVSRRVGAPPIHFLSNPQSTGTTWGSNLIASAPMTAPSTHFFQIGRAHV